ncbi:MAG: DUF427 domain-containing protein [Tabrizicola sp.]|nr:DUF427 domain-containing protein [Tabrizicola sp.]
MVTHITITAAPSPVTIRAGGTLLGTSAAALELKEGSYPPVLYIPRADIDMSRLERSERSSTCPWKGKASYYAIVTPEGRLDNAVWSYEAPTPDMQAIAGHLAFYPDKVTITKG